MTTLLPDMIQSTGPSPSRNPFARPKLPSASSFTRTSLLPTLASPETTKQPSPHATPHDRTSAGASIATSVGKERTKSWRLLWRGGLEIGKDGWRLDGIMFYAMLAFPSTPSASNVNPFDFTSPPLHSAHLPFPLPAADTDLCLSLESMRGRKYLQVRGITDLPEGEVLDGENEEGGVQVSINSQAPLLSGYLTGLLCRNEKLSAQGRTLSAVVLGLGDEGAGPSHDSTLLIYGQRTISDGPQPLANLRLCVARRRPAPPPPSARKVRPGEPLPRALVFPTKLPSKKLSHRPLSRANSSASIYAPPAQQISRAEPAAPSRSQSYAGLLPAKQLPPAPVSGRTPGRRGEKRRRAQTDDDDERKRRSGKIVIDKLATGPTPPEADLEEDIFGKRPGKVKKISFDASPDTGTTDVPSSSTDRPPPGVVEPTSTSKKRTRPPQQVLDNKATIRKQTLLLLESSGYPRDHELFKDVFSMATKGTYFAFRDRMDGQALDKLDVQRVVGIHLDMYLPAQQPDIGFKIELQGEIKVEYEEVETLKSIKEEDEDEETLIDVPDIKAEVRY